MSINKTLKGRAAAPHGGFTTLELLIIILILGIFSAILTPGWLMFINNHRLKQSLDRSHWALEIAQSNAKRDKTSWQASFKEVGENVQIAIHKSDIFPAKVPANQWKSLEPDIQINENDTTFDKVNENTNKIKANGTVWRAMFNFKGCPVLSDMNDDCTSVGAKGTLTLSHPNLPKGDRCVIISTLLGHTRTSERQTKPNPNNNKNRFCY